MARPDTLEARRLLIQAANVHRLQRHLSRPLFSAAARFRPRVLGPRNWQQAADVCRKARLLDESVIRLATTGRMPEESHV